MNINEPPLLQTQPHLYLVPYRSNQYYASRQQHSLFSPIPFDSDIVVPLVDVYGYILLWIGILATAQRRAGAEYIVLCEQTDPGGRRRINLLIPVRGRSSPGIVERFGVEPSLEDETTFDCFETESGQTKDDDHDRAVDDNCKQPNKTVEFGKTFTHSTNTDQYQYLFGLQVCP